MLLQVNCVLQEVQFTDQQRFKQLVFEFKARMQALLWTFIQQSSTVLILNINFQILEFIFCHFQNLLGGSGHKITASRMEAKLNVSRWMAEGWNGTFKLLVFWIYFVYPKLYRFYLSLCEVHIQKHGNSV